MKSELTLAEGRIRVKTPYSPAVVQRLRVIPGAKPHYDNGKFEYWSYPAVRDVVLMVCDVVGMLPFMLPEEIRQIAGPNGVEAVKRVALDESVVNGHHFITEPYAHQRRNLARLIQNDRWILADEMGTGKTHAVCNRLTHINTCKPILILCPKSVVSVWSDELRKHAQMTHFIVDEKTREIYPGAIPVITNYERLIYDKVGLTKTEWGTVILDECVPMHTLIHTPKGLQPIIAIKEGDDVFGVDHATGQVIPTKVKKTFQRQYNGHFCTVDDLWLTPHHPVWTERGYIPAKDLTSLDTILSAGVDWYHENTPTGHKKLPRLRERIHGEMVVAKKQVLQPQLSQQAICQVSERTKNRQRQHEENAQPAGRGCKTEEARFSIQEEGHSREKQGNEPRTRLQDVRQVLQSEDGIASAGALGDSFGMDNRASGRDRKRQKSKVHSARHSESNSENRSRSGRPVSRSAISEEVRPIEGNDTGQIGVENSPLQREADFGQPINGCFRHIVYNIETETGNYFANGVLVHNCHRVKNFTAKTSRLVRKLTEKAKYVWGLSGTPAPNGLCDWHGVIAAVDPDLLPCKTKTAFEARYCVKSDIGGNIFKVTGYRNVAELHDYIASITSRVTKAECLDLPEKVYSTRRVTLEGEQKRVYAELKKDAIARLNEMKETHRQDFVSSCGSSSDPVWRHPEDPTNAHLERTIDDNKTLTVSNVLTESLRLLQVVGGFVPDDLGSQHSFPEKAKLSALGDILEELGDKQCVIWCAFRAEVDFLCVWLAKYYGAVSKFMGDMSTDERTDSLNRFVSGASRYFVGTSAGGEGLNGLQVADTEVFYSRGWNLKDYLQMTDRLHRIGQKNSVNVINLVATGTVDENVSEALERKESLQSMLLRSPEEIF